MADNLHKNMNADAYRYIALGSIFLKPVSGVFEEHGYRS